jgi:hypothetical protein
MSDILAIQQVIPGEPILDDVGSLLPFYTDREIHQYRSGDWRVYVDPSVHGIVLMDRASQAGATHQQTPSAPSIAPDADSLEPRALDYMQLLAPGLDVVPLTPVRDQKGSNFFFRWEDRARPLLPDGRSRPFIQVALDAEGELLNYYNTLGF